MVRIYGAGILKEKRIVVKINNDYIYMYNVRATARLQEYSIVQPYRYINSHVGS